MALVLFDEADIDAERRLRLAALTWLRAIADSYEYPMATCARAAEIRTAIELGKPAGRDALRWLDRQCRVRDTCQRRWAQWAREQCRRAER